MQALKKTVDWLLGEKSDSAILEAEVKKRYHNRLPCFGSHWGIEDFCKEKNIFLLSDGLSLGSGFELGDISAEAASSTYIDGLFERIKETFSYVVPLYQENPWVMQIYVQDEFSLMPAFYHIEKAVHPSVKDSPFTKDYLARLKDLMLKMTRKQGLFTDPKTDMPFRGRRRRIRVLFYRLYEKGDRPAREDAISEHEEVLNQVATKLRGPGLTLKRLTGKSYYQWWTKWFHPNPEETDGNMDAFLAKRPWKEVSAVAGFNFLSAVLGNIESDDKGFSFDGLKHRIMYVDGLKAPPKTGLISREMPRDNPKHAYALLDKMPEGAMYTISVIFSDDSAINAHLQKIEKGVLGTSTLPAEVRDDIRIARNELAYGNRLYWVNQAVMYRGESEEDLKEIEKGLKNLFLDAKMPLMDVKNDLHPLNSYLNALPFNYSPLFARKSLCLERLLFASELAALLPVYGRFKGVPQMPCFVFFNRLGEPVLFDVLNPDFITQNSHLALFASSGGGKSVLTGWLVMALMAMKNSRIVLFEMGNSFDRILEHSKVFGKKTKTLMLSKEKGKAVPLNPFCDAYRAITEIGASLDEEQALVIAEKLRMLVTEPALENDKEDLREEGRSWLPELTLALRTMLTEANEEEEKVFSLADESMIIQVLSDAILTSFKKGIPQMLTEHVVEAFKRRMDAEENFRKKERLTDFHDRLLNYVINPAKSAFFNVATEPLEDFDIFHIDISAIKENKGELSLVMASLLPKIMALAEATQNEERSTFLIIDESHIQFRIPVIVLICLLLAKVARKLGLWLVPVTQNIGDLSSEEARKILSLIETWIVMGFNEQEVSDLQKFKNLTEETLTLIRGIDSVKGLFAEAVLLGSRHQGRFRVIPTRYLLALLMTEKYEKAERALLEKEHGILKAAEIMAERLENKKAKGYEDDCFFDDEFSYV